MASDARSPSSGRKARFAVYQNPSFVAAATASSLRPSSSAVILTFSFSLLIAIFAFTAFCSSGEALGKSMARMNVSLSFAAFITKTLQVGMGMLFMVSVSVLVRALWMMNVLAKTRHPVVSDTKKSDGKEIVSATKSTFNYTPVRSSRHHTATPWSRDVMFPVSHSSVSASPPRHTASPATPWSRRSTGSAKGIQTEELFEEFLAEVDEKVLESSSMVATPPSSVRSFGVVTPSTIASSATPSSATRKTPLRPARMSPNSRKYSTPPRKGEGELPPPMSPEDEVDYFEELGIYPHIENWRDYLRQWFSSVLLFPLLEKIDASHIQVMQTTTALGISITVSKIGSDTSIDHARQWQPALTLDEDGVLNQLRFSLQQARESLISAAAQIPLISPQQPLQNTSLPLLQACLDAITEHQMLKALMKGELIKGLLPQWTVCADYTVQRVRELAEGTCLKNYDFLGNGDGFDKTGKRRAGDLPTDSYLLLYLFSAFLEYPEWMLHVDPVTYTGAKSSINPLFLGILPPQDWFPMKYVAIISGPPPFLHPGACVLAFGKQNPPIFALYWDEKPQFSLQGRTALWDAILLLLHRIKLSYGGVVRGIHIGSTALDLLYIIDPNDES